MEGDNTDPKMEGDSTDPKDLMMTKARNLLLL